MKINNSVIIIIILLILTIGIGLYFLLKKDKERYAGEEDDAKEIQRRVNLIESQRRIDAPYQIDPITQILPQFLESKEIIDLATANRPLLGMFRERSTLSRDWKLIENKEQLMNFLQTILERTTINPMMPYNIPRQKYKIIIDRFYNFTDEDPLELIKIYNSKIEAVRLNNWNGPILGDLLPRSCNYLELTDYFLRDNETLDLGLDGLDYIKSIKLSWNFYGKLEIPFDCALENLDMFWCPDDYNWGITLSSRLKNLRLPRRTSDNFTIENRDLLYPFLERLEVGERIVRLPRNLRVGVLKLFLIGIRSDFENRSLQQLENEDLNSPALTVRMRERVRNEIQKRIQKIQYYAWINTINYDVLEYQLGWLTPEEIFRIVKVNGKDTITINIEP